MIQVLQEQGSFYSEQEAFNIVGNYHPWEVTEQHFIEAGTEHMLQASHVVCVGCVAGKLLSLNKALPEDTEVA